MFRFVSKQILEPVALLRMPRFLCTGSIRFQEVVKEAKPQFGQQVSSGKISAAFLGSNNAVKVLFDDNRAAEFKFIWLRDNCACPECIHPETRQKLLDTPQLDLSNIQARSVQVDGRGQLIVTWNENGMEHRSIFRSEKLLKYGRCFMEERFTHSERSVSAKRPSLQLWDGTSISLNFPEISFKEFKDSEKALKVWLDMFYRYGIALIRNVPVQKDKIIDVVRRFAYVRETSYGVTFDVVAEPNPEAHLAFTGAHLHHHTDMNYREKSPGMQLLHCLKAQDSSHGDPGGKSFFVDGFSAAEWLRQNEPTAFHLLSAVPVNFQIKTSGV